MIKTRMLDQEGEQNNIAWNNDAAPSDSNNRRSVKPMGKHSSANQERALVRQANG